VIVLNLILTGISIVMTVFSIYLFSSSKKKGILYATDDFVLFSTLISFVIVTITVFSWTFY